MNFEEFCDRVFYGHIKPMDFLVLAALIFAAILVVMGEVGCVIWFFIIIIISALCSEVAKLLMLIPCAIIFSILTAIIGLVAIKMDA